ncbi:T9SS type A sorting domain-containing protein [Hymenobacter sp. CRA2]|uniref:T9SS type A sorting domain-containing protein n=1 Tax=Hymenobacter sp. CRA2 TaxID=1955620 RepID=UPI00159211FE|nr:T9SS type A sorting domain-containing protein [Hymenobacter sp. CRA2]
MFTLLSLSVAGRAQTITLTPEGPLSFQSSPGVPSAPQSVNVLAQDINGDIVVTAPVFTVQNGTARFELSTTANGTYSQTLTLAPAAGNLNQNVFIRFYSTVATTSFFGDVVTFDEPADGFNQQVQVFGRALNPAPSLTVTPISLNDFGSVQVGAASGSQSFTIGGSNLSSAVTVTAPTGFQVQSGSGVFSNQITLTPVNGTLATTTVNVRFVPVVAGATGNQNVVVSTSNNSGGTTTRNVRVSGTGTAAPAGANINATPTVITFGNVTQSGSADTRQFTVSGTGLGTNPVTITPSNANIQVRNASAGGSFTSGALTLASNNGTISPTTIEARLVAPIPNGAFAGTIDLTSPGATPVSISISANSNGNVSDISITNPTSNTFTFATRPGTVSVPQTFLISGTNLLQPLTVFPTGPSGGYFEVSADNITYSSQISFTPDGQGNVTQRPVYVRFVPGNNAVTVNAIIRATSSPAPDRDVSVTGISEPTVRLNRVLGFFGDAVVKNETTAPISVRLDAFLLTGPLYFRFPNDTDDPQRNPTNTPQFEFSTDNGATYVKSDTLLNNNEGNRSINLLVRYAPTRVGNSAQELLFRNAALMNNAEFALTSGNGRAQGFAIAPVPTAQSTARVVRAGASATITFDLTNPPAGESYGQNRLVIASSTYRQLPPSLFPQAKQNFNPGVTQDGAYQFGTGTPIETSSNTFVVFSGAANSFTVGNLDPALDYYFFAFEFNDDGLLNAENYKVPNNEPQVPLPVELVSFDAKLRNGKVALTWVTAQEKNNRGFELQRSQNGRDFTSFGFVAGHGTSSVRHEYSAEDAQPLAGTSYYRLKQIDNDGSVSYSQLVAVKNGRTAEVTVFPNPMDDVLNVRLASPGADAEVVVSDMMGRVVLRGKLSADGTFNTSSLRSGNYIVTVTNGAEKTNHKVTKR